MIVVTPLETSSIYCLIIFSVNVSKEEVASSNNINLGFFSRARAIEILYFSPPLNLNPLSPTF